MVMRLSPSLETRDVDSTSIPYKVLASWTTGEIPAEDLTIVPCKSKIAHACCPGIGYVSGLKVGSGTACGCSIDAIMIVEIDIVVFVSVESLFVWTNQ